MLFNSVAYIVLLAGTVAAYWVLPTVRGRQVVLLIASLIFYISWIPIYALLLLSVVAFTYGAVLFSDRGLALAAFIAVAVNLLALGIFKYAGFAGQVMADIFTPLIGEMSFTTLHVILPLGISFYVFQLIAYIVDVKRGTIERERDPLIFTLFIVFFPQLIAGPICRGSELLPQLRRKQPFDDQRFFHGLLLLASGLFLKIAIADNISPFVDQVFAAPTESNSTDAILGVIGFGVVIFCDFWGYSTMAVGSALLFGIVVPMNFNLPYVARSLQEFWRRWHITLSNWLRDYLYKPLGGSRNGPVMTGRNLLIVMVLGGLWHGAAYTFLVWGAIHGLWLVIERVWRSRIQSIGLTRAWWWPAVGTVGGWAATMAVVFLAWTFFRAQNLEDAFTLIGRVFTFDGLSVSDAARRMLPFLGLYLVLHIPLHFLHINHQAARLTDAARIILAFWLMLAAIILGSGETNEFIYFQF